MARGRIKKIPPIAVVFMNRSIPFIRTFLLCGKKKDTGFVALVSIKNVDLDSYSAGLDGF
jgi:hypothetical protein